MSSQKINFKFQLQMQPLWGNENQWSSSLLAKPSVVKQVLGIHTILLCPLPQKPDYQFEGFQIVSYLKL